MVAVPGVRPETSPETGLTEATDGLLLDHEPPASPLELNVVLVDTQMVEAPLTVPALTFGLTVTDADALAGAPQPVLMV